MSIKVLDTTFYEETGQILANTSQLKSYNILYDRETEDKFLNIWRAFTLSEDTKNSYVYFNLHEVEQDEWWDTISNTYYGSPYLWWIIAIINEVTNPFEYLIPGTTLKILKEKYIYQMLKEIKSIGDL